MNFIDCAKIWDLHIHTNKCPKGNSNFVKEYKNNTEKYITDLLDVLKSDKAKKVDMISFTDHNHISLEVYQKFYEKENEIVLLPGVEIDCITSSENNESKHILVYFDCGKEEIIDLSVKINELLKNNGSPKYIDIKDLLEGLNRTGYNFIISPHAFKQDKRGIEFDWNDEKSAKKQASMYMDQFFVFWESSGYSNIEKAKEFLCEFELEEKISVVSFSDSNNFEKLEEYISKTQQYFNSLPSFKGLAMVGSDTSRIRKKSIDFEENRNPGIIKEIEFCGNKIYLSKQLNTIIGGRGSGKSILLDSVANKLGKDIFDKKRVDFINKFEINIKNFNDMEINSSFEIDYFNQAYVNHLFSDDNFSEKLKDKFSDSFSKLTMINKEEIESENKNKFFKLLYEEEIVNIENLDSFTNNYPLVSNDGLNIKIFKSEKTKINKNNDIIKYKDELKKIDDFFDTLPEQIKSSNNISYLKSLLKYGVIREINKYNNNAYKTQYLLNSFIDNFSNKKSDKSEITKRKRDVEEKLKSNIIALTCNIKFKNDLINAYFKLTDNFKALYTDFHVEDGSEIKRFIFSNELKVETPSEYLIKVFNKHINSRKYNEVNYDNLKDICKKYINGKLEDILKDNSTLKAITDELLSFNLEYDFQNNIYYIDDNEIKNILEQSPGTQTNILMEYIVYKQTSKPLLIDQPEDNIDNKTIYDKLRIWFSELKFKRQVIVVTHDANIVINADAENVIVAEQKTKEDFKYHYGALEFENIIDEASSILDGGKDAVKRRLAKYES